ncbi:MAG: exonuclease SbcCD subunit D [Chloroflexota bacterium]|nr:exonuclease SbcCD subunit D [Chloroflexota bacterium]
MRFMQVADIHLGYQQYGSKERFNDFSQVFLYIVEQAIEQQVDFVLLAGDLFEKRTVDPLAMRVAIEGFRMLREAGIPVVAVEGNHEKAHYRDQYSWVDFLDGLGYLHLLNPRFEDGRAILEPYGDTGGAYLDLPGGVRVYGLKYYGASTGKVFGLFADALADMDHGDVEFAILVSHAGLEGQLPRYSGTLTYNDLVPLRERINYLALGHIHKPYAVDGWIYNPGSPETWSIEEVTWRERGYYLVEVHPGCDPDHQAELVATPRRPFHRFRLEVDTLTDPNLVYDAVRALLEREGSTVAPDSAPVVELTLGGVLPFSRYDLDLDYIKGLLDDAWSPLVTRVRNRTTPAEFEIAVDVEASRPELERTIVRELLERDARFRPAADDWTRIALDVKRLVLEDNAHETVIDYLRRSITQKQGFQEKTRFLKRGT